MTILATHGSTVRKSLIQHIHLHARDVKNKLWVVWHHYVKLLL